MPATAALWVTGPWGPWTGSKRSRSKGTGTEKSNKRGLKSPQERLELPLLDLDEVQFDRGGATEDGHHHLDGGALFVDLVNVSFEIGEGARSEARRVRSRG